MKVDDPTIDTAQTPKVLDRHLALLKKIRQTFTDSNPNKSLLKRELSLGPRRVILYSQIKLLEFSFHQSALVVVTHKKPLVRPRGLAALIDQFRFC